MSPRVSVIIPHYNDLEGLDACLTALTAQTCPADTFEIVIADNNSPQGAAAVEAAINGRARLVIITEKGAGPARNGAVAAARGEILAFTDADCRPAPNWLEVGLAALSRHDIVGGRVDVFVTDPQHPTAAEAFDALFGFDNQAMVLDKGFTVTANQFCARALFNSVGGFMTGVSEDVEWSHRARAKGFTLGYADDAIVDHPARKTWEELEAKWLRVDSETFQLHLMYGKSRAVWLARCLALPASAIFHTPKLLMFKKLPLAGRFRGVGMLFRVRLWRSLNCLRLLRSAATSS